MINKKELSKHIGSIGYDILDEIVSPVCGIGAIMADLYLAEINTYTSCDEKENKKIFKLISKKYNIKMDKEYFSEAPIALLALYIMEESDYFGNYYKPRKLKTKEAKDEIAKYVLKMKKKKKFNIAAWIVARDLNLPIIQVEKIMEKWEQEGRIKSID